MDVLAYARSIPVSIASCGMERLPDFRIKGVVFKPETCQFAVTFEIGDITSAQPVGMIGEMRFWVEYDNSDDKHEARKLNNENVAISDVPGGVYTIDVPGVPVPAPPESGYLILEVRYTVPPPDAGEVDEFPVPDRDNYISDDNAARQIRILTYVTFYDAETKSATLARGFVLRNPKTYVVPRAQAPTERKEEDKSVEWEDEEEKEKEEDGEKSADSSRSLGPNNSLGEDSDSSDEEEDEDEEPSGKRPREDDEDDGPPAKAPRLSCSLCGRKAHYTCSGCMVAAYCNRDCQAGHYATHREACGF